MHNLIGQRSLSLFQRVPHAEVAAYQYTQTSYKSAAIWGGFALGMRVLWARKLECYHDLMSFRRRRFIKSLIQSR